jgi:stage III sporulation protein AD
VENVMDILQIAGLCILTVIIIAVLKEQRPELAVQISILTGIVIFLLVAGKISAVIDLLSKYTTRFSIDPFYINILLKIIGIAYIAEFSAEICRDAGETSIASRIELAGKVMIIVLAAPLVTSLLELVISIMP